MPDDSFDGTPINADFRSKSQWRVHARWQADNVPLDQVPVCGIDLVPVSGRDGGVTLDITAPFPPHASAWVYTTHERAALRSRDEWRTDLHLEVLPTRRFRGCLLRLARRVYPSSSQAGQGIGELGHAFFRVDARSFETSPTMQNIPVCLACSQTLVRLVKEVDELILHLGGELMFVSGVFCSGSLTKTQKPRKTFHEIHRKSGYEILSSPDILEEVSARRPHG